MEKYRKIIESRNGNWFRLGKTFRTSNALFFIDTGTGKVFKIDSDIYRILDCLFKTNDFDNLYKIKMKKENMEQALEEICKAIETQNLFSAPILSKENITGSHFELSENVNNNMSSITLELTERCNLRCKYCVYSETNSDYRTFGENDMSIETAKKSIDFLMTHSPNDKKVYIGFYGGEPLLRFQVIKEIINYVEEVYSNREVMYSMTSNMTLMTEEMAEFLTKVKNFSIVVSMDGPEEVYNMQRVFPNGKGAFLAAMKGLDIYMKAKKDSINSDEPIAFSVVVTQPYTQEKFEVINDFFSKLKEKYNFMVLISYVSETSIPEEYEKINQRIENKWEDIDESDQIYDPLMIWTLNNIEKSTFSMNYFRRGALLEIHKRVISEKPINQYSLNGCCIPGARRLYVTVNGDFLPCERIGTQLPIGNINSGFDISFIKKKYVDDFVEQEIKYCGECWAINLCNNCYMNCFGENEMDFSHRHAMCRNTRKRISESLSIYHEVMTLNPEMINELNSVTIE